MIWKITHSLTSVSHKLTTQYKSIHNTRQKALKFQSWFQKTMRNVWPMQLCSLMQSWFAISNHPSPMHPHRTTLNSLHPYDTLCWTLPTYTQPPWHSSRGFEAEVFTGQMYLLSPKQQHQSTDGRMTLASIFKKSLDSSLFHSLTYASLIGLYRATQFFWITNRKTALVK